jgi:heat-inducible transcriptional repressor
VPTDKGYRLFVDRLATVRPLSSAERRAIASFLEQAVDLDDVVARTSRLLAQLTSAVAMVQYPSLVRSTVRHIDLVPLSPSRGLLVVITNTGRVEQRHISGPEPVGEETMAALRTDLAGRLEGRPLADIAAALAGVLDRYGSAVRPFVQAAVDALVEAVELQSEERVVVAGAANLTRYGVDFHSSVFPVLEALEEHVVLLRLLSEQGSDDAITVRIGAENPLESMAQASVVTTGYRMDIGEVGRIGLVGPRRMDYGANMSAVRAVARYLGRILADQ